MISVLMLVFFILLICVGKGRGLRTFLCFCLNYSLIIAYICFLILGFHAIIASLITCVIASLLSLYVLNGVNKKTKAAFQSICIILCFMFTLIYLIGKNANMQGFSHEALETISLFTYDIHYNMTNLVIGLILVCSIGTIIDTSISISTSLNEIYINNPQLGTLSLFKSGMNVGRDILSTTINTLFFVFLGGMIGFFIWHQHDSMGVILNYKSFMQETMELLCCCIGSIVVIPVTSYITATSLCKK